MIDMIVLIIIKTLAYFVFTVLSAFCYYYLRTNKLIPKKKWILYLFIIVPPIGILSFMVIMAKEIMRILNKA